MTDRPILFSGPMVRAILAGTKTETRRVVKPAPSQRKWLDVSAAATADPAGSYGVQLRLADGSPLTCVPCPYGVPGDRLWVREAWCRGIDRVPGDGRPTHPTEGWSCLYRATEPEACNAEHPSRFAPWKPSIHMPRWASRLTLAVKSVRVERLHDIDDAGARAEGVADREAFRALWSEINGAESWDSNPWVWVVGFERVTS